MTKPLPSDLEAFIQRKVASGSFPDRDAVVAEAVRQLAEQDAYDRYVAESVAEAEEDFRQGNYVEIEADKIGDYLKQLVEEAKA